jgi:glycerophosphoryl diester phosphodiesterase
VPARCCARPLTVDDRQRCLGVGGVCIEYFLLHHGLVERLRSGGLSVMTGTVNDAALAVRAAGLGVDAITTDRPAALHHELAASQLLAA